MDVAFTICLWRSFLDQSIELTGVLFVEYFVNCAADGATRLAISFHIIPT